jgi:hypothetical protein
VCGQKYQTVVQLNNRCATVQQIMKYVNKYDVATALTKFSNTHFLVSASSNLIVEANVKLKVGPL